MARRAGWLVLMVGLPVGAAVLWGASGRETFSKHWRAVEISVTDEVFGDKVTQTRQVAGPILGYYVGLDIVAAAVAVAAVSGGARWYLRLRKRSAESRERGNS